MSSCGIASITPANLEAQRPVNSKALTNMSLPSKFETSVLSHQSPKHLSPHD